MIDLKVDEIPEYSTEDRMNCIDRDLENDRDEFNERSDTLHNSTFNSNQKSNTLQ